MFQSFDLNRAIFARSLYLFFLSFMVIQGSSVLAISGFPCESRDTLLLNQSVLENLVSAQGAARYHLEIPFPGILVSEVHQLGDARNSPQVRLLDQECQVLQSNVAVPQIRGRHIHQIHEPGRFILEILPESLRATEFRITAWVTPVRRAQVISLGMPHTWTKNGVEDEDDGPHEPMDEWDELVGGNYGNSWSHSSWSEFGSIGLLQVKRSPNGDRTRLHSWCQESPTGKLSSTFTCARWLSPEDSGLSILKVSPEAQSVVLGLRLKSRSRFVVEAAGSMEIAAALFNSQGWSLETRQGEWLSAGSYFLKINNLAQSPEVSLYIEID